MPMAMNCSVWPWVRLGLVGLTMIIVRVAGVTVRVAGPLVTLPSVAVMFVVPVATPVASPVLEIVATAVLDDAQVTWLVTSRLEPSENVPMAANCWVWPLATLGLAGVTAMDTKDEELTVSPVEPVTLPFVAVMVVGAAPT